MDKMMKFSIISLIMALLIFLVDYQFLNKNVIIEGFAWPLLGCGFALFVISLFREVFED